MTNTLVDPELRAALEAFPAFEFNDETLPAIRAMLGGAAPSESCCRDDVLVERRSIPGPAGAPDLPIIIHRPVASQSPMPALLHIHGGGFVRGCAEGSSVGNADIAAGVGCLVISVDYRLAPETTAPGSVEDCYAALRWLHAEADTLGVGRTRIAVGGERAGGGLAAALALLARDRGEYPLCFQLLIYPMLDDHTGSTAPVNPHTGAFIWTPASNRVAWRCLLGMEPGGTGTSAYAAPARAECLVGLPPAYICVGTVDLFLDEDIAFARRLLDAGVPTELHVLPGAYHGFELASEARVTRLSEQSRRAALAKAFELR